MSFLHLEKQKEFEYLSIEDFCPSDPHKKYHFIQNLQSRGLAFKSALLTYFHGNNVGNFHFIWRISEEASCSDLIESSQHPIEALKSKIPFLPQSRVEGSAYVKVWKDYALFEACSFTYYVQGINR